MKDYIIKENTSEIVDNLPITNIFNFDVFDEKQVSLNEPKVLDHGSNSLKRKELENPKLLDKQKKVKKE